ncbi:MAG TPA: ribose 5-phosphate isomerase B [Vicinamibacteria bacterium]|nr:ribose 5-phosphate isomerase B [Vicinamibacteria bacterium]
MKTALIVGSDHAGFELKEHLKRALERRGIAYQDVGTHSGESVDYPDFAHQVGRAVSTGQAEKGLLVCGSGQGMAMVANKYPGVRAALPFDEESARLSREHNDANVLALGGRVVSPQAAERILDAWLATPFAGGRHEKRVKKIDPR